MSILKKIILEEINNSNLADSEYVYINSEGNLINIPKEYLFKIREINNIDKNTEILHARYFQHYNPGDFWQAARTGIWSTIFLEDRIINQFMVNPAEEFLEGQVNYTIRLIDDVFAKEAYIEKEKSY